MSNNTFELMASGRSYEEVLQLLAATPVADLEEAGATVTDEQLPWILTFADKTIRSAGVLDTIVCGALLYAVSFLSKPAHRRELIDNLYEDLALSRTQGHRCVQVWRQFGPQLQAEPKLKRFFCAESLKILAEERTQQAARDEALQLAREETKVTIKVATALQAKHGMLPPSDESAAVPVSESARKGSRRTAGKWLFVGSAARIEVFFTDSQQAADVDAVIRDLEAAIVELRNEKQTKVA